MPGIIAFSLSYFCIRFAALGVYYWMPTYLQEQHNFNKTEALDIYSWFSTGSIFGNALLGLITDLLPIRSPVFEIGIITSAILMFLQNSLTSYGALSTQNALMGATLNGSQMIIVAIECDIGNYVKKKYDLNALGTFAGVIDGFASIGAIISQFIIGEMKDKYGWVTLYNILAVILSISTLPAISFIIFEVKQWR